MNGAPHNQKSVSPSRSSLRRMKTDIQSSSSSNDRCDYWQTVLDEALLNTHNTTSFPFGSGLSSLKLRPTQSFHLFSTSSSRPGSSRHHLPSRCQICPEFEFSDASSADLTTHKEKNQNSSPRPFKCSQCFSAFSQKSHLTQHVRGVHQKVRPLKCEFCGKAFGRKFDLSSHRDAVHRKRQPHECTHCRKRFAKKSNLKRHIRRHSQVRHSYKTVTDCNAWMNALG